MFREEKNTSDDEPSHRLLLMHAEVTPQEQPEVHTVIRSLRSSPAALLDRPASEPGESEEPDQPKAPDELEEPEDPGRPDELEEPDQAEDTTTAATVE